MYVAKCKHGTIIAGQTRDPKRSLAAHGLAVAVADIIDFAEWVIEQLDNDHMLSSIDGDTVELTRCAECDDETNTNCDKCKKSVPGGDGMGISDDGDQWLCNECYRDQGRDR